MPGHGSLWLNLSQASQGTVTSMTDQSIHFQYSKLPRALVKNDVGGTDDVSQSLGSL